MFMSPWGSSHFKANTLPERLQARTVTPYKNIGIFPQGLHLGSKLPKYSKLKFIPRAKLKKAKCLPNVYWYYCNLSCQKPYFKKIYIIRLFECLFHLFLESWWSHWAEIVHVLRHKKLNKMMSFECIIMHTFL